MTWTDRIAAILARETLTRGDCIVAEDCAVIADELAAESRQERDGESYPLWTRRLVMAGVRHNLPVTDTLRPMLQQMAEMADIVETLKCPA